MILPLVLMCTNCLCSMTCMPHAPLSFAAFYLMFCVLAYAKKCQQRQGLSPRPPCLIPAGNHAWMLQAWRALRPSCTTQMCCTVCWWHMPWYRLWCSLSCCVASFSDGESHSVFLEGLILSVQHMSSKTRLGSTALNFSHISQYTAAFVYCAMPCLKICDCVWHVLSRLLL